MRRGRIRRVLLVSLPAWLGACATVDFDYPKTSSTASAPRADSYWGRENAELPAITDGESGFRLLSDGVEALAARLIMAEEAEHTLDVQYYLIHDDVTGDLLMTELLNAADRGVRVRLLLDDVFTKGSATRLWVLDAHPRIEVRIFNPFATRWLRYLRSGLSFKRVNRRMHNKSFTVDNLVTVIGGRNIGDEYFGARTDVNFGDLDVLAFGPVVREVSAMFDTYWNDRLAVPVPALVSAPSDPERRERELRRELDQSDEQARGTRYAEALDDSVQALVASKEDQLIWCRYQLVYDPPEKAQVSWSVDEDSILTPLRQALDEMTEELVVVSPYFVLQRRGIGLFGETRERGVEIRVITNSLAANNHAIVHAGYATTRKPLLDLGVELYEVRSDARISGVARAGNEGSRATLHTKAFIIDRKRLFVGSFNWDPRSAYINTEMGIILDDAALAEALVAQVLESLPTLTYRLATDERGGLVWCTTEDGEEVVYYSEPGAGCLRKLTVGLLGLLPIKGQL